jgi:radical SAM modification target selenobiotic family peptide
MTDSRHEGGTMQDELKKVLAGCCLAALLAGASAAPTVVSASG